MENLIKIANKKSFFSIAKEKTNRFFDKDEKLRQEIMLNKYGPGYRINKINVLENDEESLNNRIRGRFFEICLDKYKGEIGLEFPEISFSSEDNNIKINDVSIGVSLD